MSKRHFPSYPPYLGREPYLYFCFHRDDREKVRPLLSRLYARGCRVWYSLGRSRGLRQTRVQNERIKGAAFMAVYLTAKVLEDTDLSASFQFYQALDREAVLLVPGGLPPDWELLAARAFQTHTAEVGALDTPEALESALIRSEGFSRDLIGKPFYPLVRFFKRAATAVAALILAAGMLIVYTRLYMPIPPEPPATTSAPAAAVFADPIVLSAAKDALMLVQADVLTEDALAGIALLRLRGTPETLEDLALLPGLKRLEIPQGCVPLAATLPEDRAYTVAVYGEAGE